MELGGRTAISIHSIPSPAPKQKNKSFVDHQKKEPPNSTATKVAETKQPIKVLHPVRTGAIFGRGGGAFRLR